MLTTPIAGADGRAPRLSVSRETIEAAAHGRQQGGPPHPWSSWLAPSGSPAGQFIPGRPHPPQPRLP